MLQPQVGLDEVPRNALARTDRDSQLKLCIRQTPLRRFAVPGSRLCVILMNTSTRPVHHAEIVLRNDLALLGGFAVPSRRHGVVPGHTAVPAIDDTQVHLGANVSLLGRFAEPFQRLGIVPLNPIALTIHDPDVVLRVDITALRQRTQFLHRRDEIAFPVSGIRRLPSRPRRKYIEGQQRNNDDPT